MKRVILLFFLIPFMLSCQQTDQESFSIHRGTNVSHWLSQSSRRGGERLAWFTEADMDLIASLGYDHIRLPVDEEQLWDESGNRVDEAFNLLHDAIGWALDRDLKVVVDLHIVRAHHFNKAERPLWTDPASQESFVRLWEELSYELSGYAVHDVAYELMNEAVADNPDDWNKLIQRTHAAIRKLEPERKIIIGSNQWQSVNTFVDLVIPENDPNIILSFHFYHPLVLTHYRASWTKVGEYNGPVHYPGKVVPDSALRLLPEDLRVEVAWWSGVYTIDSMRQEIMKPVEYAARHSLPLYCGEFGCLPTVPEADRLAWYVDVVDVLEENDIAWSHWDYKGGFGIIDQQGTRNQSLIRALLGDH